MADTLRDEPLLRSVAVLQLQRQLLDQQADQLIELADMQAHRRIRSDLAEYVAAHAKSGVIPADPLAVVQQRLDCCSHFFAEAKELHRTSVDSFARFLADGLPQVSLTALHRAQAEVEQAAAELPARLQALAAQLDPRDWDGSAADADLHPEMLVCAQGLGLDLPKAASARRALRRLALGDGKLHAEIQAHFQSVRVRLAELAAVHARHRETLQQTAAQVALDNHLTAAQRLKADGLHEQAFRGFSDLDYAKAQTDLAALCATVHAAVSFAEGLPTSCRLVLKRFQELATTSQRDEGRAKANGALAILHRDFAAHWAKATAQPSSEAEKKCRPPLETARAALAQAEATLEVMAAAGAKKRRRNLLLAAVGVLILAGAFYFGGSEMRRAAEKQAAEAKALAEKQAPEATEKRLEWTGKAMQRAGFKEEAVKRTLTKGGTVVAWGNNGSGQTKVPAGLSGVVAMAAGGWHTVALKLE